MGGVAGELDQTGIRDPRRHLPHRARSGDQIAPRFRISVSAWIVGSTSRMFHARFIRLQRGRSEWDWPRRESSASVVQLSDVASASRIRGQEVLDRPRRSPSAGRMRSCSAGRSPMGSRPSVPRGASTPTAPVHASARDRWPRTRTPCNHPRRIRTQTRARCRQRPSPPECHRCVPPTWPRAHHDPRAGASLVEPDESTIRADPLHPLDFLWPIPIHIEMRHSPRGEHEIDRRASPVI